MSRKPLGIKSYGHIAHLPGSRMGPSDHHCHEGQARIATLKARDRHDHIIVQEKLDGCLSYRTPIWTDRGPIEIGKIVNQQLPVLIASYNEVARIIEFKPILKYHKQPSTTGWLRVVIRGLKHGSSKKQIVCTPNHHFYSQGCYKRADELSPGDVVHLSGIDIPREAKQVVLGGLLGDSGLLHTNVGGFYGFTFLHSTSQNDYFDFKMRLFGSLVYEVKGGKGGLDDVLLEPTNSLFETEVIAIETDNVKVWEGESSQYDLTIADNHNYFASDILVHNSNVSVARLGERIVALTRAGYIASTSPYEQHHHFEKWAHRNRDRFMAVLQDGERLCGEWLMQAHGTRYQLPHEPFVAFDLMLADKRTTFDLFLERLALGAFITPHLIHRGSPLSIEDALRALGTYGFHGALDPVEGAVWRVERNEQINPSSGERRLVVDFLVKYVRPDKVDGGYLSEMSGQPSVYNWQPA